MHLMLPNKLNGNITANGFFAYFDDAKVLHRLHSDVLLNATYFYIRLADDVTIHATGNEEPSSRFVQFDVGRRWRQEPEA